PNIWYFDGRVSRRFSLSESMKLEVLAEGFNWFNRTQATGVNSTFYTFAGTTLTYNPSFGATTGADSTLFRERQIQFAARFEFYKTRKLKRHWACSKQARPIFYVPQL